MEKRWIILIVSGTLIMTTLIVGLLIHASFHRDFCPENVCQTPECVQAAAKILNYIDVDADPCNNFYNFACGNFVRTAEIPDDFNEISTNTLMGETLQKQLKSALEEPAEVTEIKTFKALKTYYQACGNTEAIERRGLKVVRDLLHDLGGWPVLEDQTWEGKNLDWFSYVYKFRQLGLNTNHIMLLYVQSDFKNSTFYILQIDQPIFTLPREFLIGETQNKYVEEYRRYMTNIAVYLGANEFRATVELRDSLKFEMKLANISFSKESRSNISNFYNIMTIKQLEEQYSTIPWLEYINNLISPHYQVTIQEKILVLVPEYLRKLEELLQRTPRRDQINYLMWKAIASVIPYVSEDLREMQFKFESVTSGIVQQLPRWKECLQQTYQSFPIALSALYVRTFFDYDVKISAQEILDNVKQEYIEAIEELDWIDEKTKKSALAKAKKMTDVVGYPMEMLHDNKLEEIYGEVEVHAKEYLRSFLNASINMENLKYKRLRMLKSKTSWIEHGRVAEVDALYTPLTNTITIPAGILQEPYFNQKHPNYLNYGGIGFAIGHEITHAFDETGRFFDKNGNMVNWWEKETEILYTDRTKCIINQYDNYTVEEINQTVNGIITLDDNIADNGGVKHAYLAYLKWVKENGEEKKLPGLDYIPNQLFWISFALTQCSKQRPEHQKLAITTDVHAPPEFRVVGSLSNLREFASDFDCPDDSAMYSEDVCTVW